MVRMHALRGFGKGTNQTCVERRLYREYPTREFNSVGKREGYSDNLVMYCGMAYDKGGNAEALRSVGAADSLYVWSKEVTDELNKRGDLSKLQLDAFSYLWELGYDLLLAKSDNVSASPGFETLLLRVNNEQKREKMSTAGLPISLTWGPMS